MREIRRRARKRLNTEFTESGAQRSQRQLGEGRGKDLTQSSQRTEHRGHKETTRPGPEQEGGSSGGAAGEAREEREIGRDAGAFGKL